eukprot:TRINITY_DN2508_c0_g1_i10.p2 TRINITY_DN2508_c0_g1~~TRINITY_DN2508_c0_g1_i10.p2  ORF type:complete len:221 (+),score=39.19 TRINITY_DN2508_c0_g1_i10:70-732(+)
MCIRDRYMGSSQAKVLTLKNLVRSVGICSKAGRNSDKSSKHNQDIAFHTEHLGKVRNAHLFGVVDGHGDYGLTLSNQVREALSRNLAAILNDMLALKPVSAQAREVRRQLIAAAFEKAQADVVAGNREDASESGATATVVLAIGRSLVCANVGDSRAYAVSGSKGAWEALQLSTDHRPKEIHEYDRIVKSKGQVHPCYGIPSAYFNRLQRSSLRPTQSLG